MMDGKLLYSWAYAVQEQINGETVQVPSLPGPTLFVRQGQTVTITLNNTMTPGTRPAGEAHGFTIFGKSGRLVQSAALAPGQTTQVTIPNTLAPGTYIYEDWVNAPVGRVLGLHGVLVVMPNDTVTPCGNLGASHPVQQLFSDLGTTPHFPGEPWLPSRQVIWVFSEIDPVFNARAQTEVINPTEFTQNFLPQYFTVNGRSGYFAAEDHTHGTAHVHVDFMNYLLSSELESALVGKVGQPLLVRNVHVGLDTHSPHTPANHSYILAVDGDIQGLNLDANGFPVHGNPGNLGLWWVDTWTMLPGDRKDVLYPMMLPVDQDPELAFLNPIPARVQMGQTLLVRLLCAAYGNNTYTFEGLDVEVIAMDGRVLGQDPYTRYSALFKIPAGVPFSLTAARRFDLLIRPTSAQVGSHRVLVEFQDHITKLNLGIAETFIHVLGQGGGGGVGGGQGGGRANNPRRYGIAGVHGGRGWGRAPFSPPRLSEEILS